MAFKIVQPEIWVVTDEDGSQYMLEKVSSGRFLIGRKVIFDKITLVQILDIATTPVWITQPNEAVAWYQVNVEKKGVS